MASERLNMVVFLTITIMATMQTQISDAINSHTVGDSTGWDLPPDPDFYDNWADSHTFVVGDTLVFNFDTGDHTVVEVTKEAYDACNSDNSIAAWFDGPAKVTLKSPGPHYYICGKQGHCDEDQSLAITVKSL